MTPPMSSLTMDNSTQLNLSISEQYLSNAPSPVMIGSAVQVCERDGQTNIFRQIGK